VFVKLKYFFFMFFSLVGKVVPAFMNMIKLVQSPVNTWAFMLKIGMSLGQGHCTATYFADLGKGVLDLNCMLKSVYIKYYV
jgi:hypothetical protein